MRVVAPTLAALVVAGLVGTGATACAKGRPAPVQLAEVGPGASDGAEARFAYEIPAGTGDRLAAGEAVTLLPSRIEARIGDVIRITNLDRRAYVLGPFFVGAGEVVTQRFASTGAFVGVCEIDPSGQLAVVVSD